MAVVSKEYSKVNSQDSLTDLCEGNCDFCGDDATRAAYEERRLERQGEAVGPNIV